MSPQEQASGKHQLHRARQPDDLKWEWQERWDDPGKRLPHDKVQHTRNEKENPKENLCAAFHLWRSCNKP